MIQQRPGYKSRCICTYLLITLLYCVLFRQRWKYNEEEISEKWRVNFLEGCDYNFQMRGEHASSEHYPLNFSKCLLGSLSYETDNHLATHSCLQGENFLLLLLFLKNNNLFVCPMRSLKSWHFPRKKQPKMQIFANKSNLWKCILCLCSISVSLLI